MVSQCQSKKVMGRTWRHVKNPINLTLTSKVCIVLGSWMYTTHYLIVIDPCALNFVHGRYKYQHTYQHFRKKQSKPKQFKYFDNHLATCSFLQKQRNLSSFLIYAWLYEKCWRKQTRHSNLSKFISSAALKDLALYVHHIELTWSSSGPFSM